MRKTYWTQELLKKGFDKFKREHRRLPTSSEIGPLPYLPSSRTIEKRFGGLPNLLSNLGYPKSDINRGVGSHRSKIALRVGERGREYKEKTKLLLQQRYGAKNVLIDWTFCGRYRVDFFIQCKQEDFGVDAFYPDTLRTMQSNVNLKMRKFQHFPSSLYLVVANPDITQKMINTYVSRKRNPLPSTVNLISHKKFLSAMNQTKG